MTFSNQPQKMRKNQQPKSEEQIKKDKKVAIRKAKRNRRNVWIVKEEL